MTIRISRRTALGGLFGSLAFGAFGTGALAQAPQTIRIADLEILSGGFAILGETNARSIEAGVEEWNNRPGQTIRYDVRLFDTKGSAQEAQAIFSQIVDQGIRYMTGGGTSAIVSVLLDQVARHNERNPGQEIIYLNHQAIDPSFTNERCGFWHFRFDPHVYQRMEALTRFLADDRQVKGVYLINQDYNFGQQVQASARQQLAAKRPDIRIVGDELHPIGRVRDFTPFVTKIKASGADTVITGNFGPDLALLVRAANDIGLTASIYTYYASLSGTPTAIGEAGANRVRLVTGLDMNALNPRMSAIYKTFKERHPRLEVMHCAYFDMIEMVGAAAKKAGSIDPGRVARALEGLTIEGTFGPVTMRAEDHQVTAPLFVQTLDKVDGTRIKVGVEGLNLGFRTERKFAASDTMLAHSCAMRRPS